MGNELGKEESEFLKKRCNITKPNQKKYLKDCINENDLNSIESERLCSGPSLSITIPIQNNKTFKSKIKEKIDEIAHRCEFSYD